MRFLWVCVVWLLAGSSAWAGQITISINNVRSDKGEIRVALCTRAAFLHPNCPFHGTVLARHGTVSVVFSDVPPGLYAAQAFHDEDSNHRLDRDIWGRPMEGVGVSRNAQSWMGPPKFEDAAVVVGRDGAAISFDLKYRN